MPPVDARASPEHNTDRRRRSPFRNEPTTSVGGAAPGAHDGNRRYAAGFTDEEHVRRVGGRRQKRRVFISPRNTGCTPRCLRGARSVPGPTSRYPGRFHSARQRQGPRCKPRGAVTNAQVAPAVRMKIGKTPPRAGRLLHITDHSDSAPAAWSPVIRSLPSRSAMWSGPAPPRSPARPVSPPRSTAATSSNRPQPPNPCRRGDPLRLSSSTTPALAAAPPQARTSAGPHHPSGGSPPRRARFSPVKASHRHPQVQSGRAGDGKPRPVPFDRTGVAPTGDCGHRRDFPQGHGLVAATNWANTNAPRTCPCAPRGPFPLPPAGGACRGGAGETRRVRPETAPPDRRGSNSPGTALQEPPPTTATGVALWWGAAEGRPVAHRNRPAGNGLQACATSRASDGVRSGEHPGEGAWASMVLPAPRRSDEEQVMSPGHPATIRGA